MCFDCLLMYSCSALILLLHLVRTTSTGNINTGKNNDDHVMCCVNILFMHPPVNINVRYQNILLLSAYMQRALMFLTSQNVLN